MKKRPTIVLYTTNNSRMCDLARDYFRVGGFIFDEINLDREAQYKKGIYERAGKETTPIVEINNRIVVGYRPEVYEILLEGSGKE